MSLISALFCKELWAIGPRPATGDETHHMFVLILIARQAASSSISDGPAGCRLPAQAAVAPVCGPRSIDLQGQEKSSCFRMLRPMLIRLPMGLAPLRYNAYRALFLQQTSMIHQPPRLCALCFVWIMTHANAWLIECCSVRICLDDGRAVDTTR